MNIRTKKTIGIGAFISFIVVLVALFLLYKNTWYFPKNSEKISGRVNDYGTLYDNPVGNNSNLIHNRYGFEQVRSRIKGTLNYYLLQNDIDNTVILNSRTEEYLVKPTFVIPSVEKNEIKKIIVAEQDIIEMINFNYTRRLNDYDTEELNETQQNSIISALKGYGNPIDINRADLTHFQSNDNWLRNEFRYIRVYFVNSPVFLVVGIIVNYDGNLYFSLGTLSENGEIIKYCYLINN